MGKHRLARLNRGLLLGAVLFLGTVVWLITDGISFRKEIPSIEQVVREYVEQSPQMAILPSPYNRAGSPADSAAIQQKQAENEAFLRWYWSFSAGKDGYNQSEILLRQIQDAVEYNGAGGGSILSARGIVQSVRSIRKTGWNRAEVSFSYTGAIRCTGDVRWVLFGVGPADAQARSRSGGERRLAPSGEITAVLVKTGGQWRFDRVEVSSMYGS